MSTAVNRFVLGLVAYPILVASQAAAGSGQDGADRFVPSFAFNSGVLIQDWEADAESRLCRDCNFSDPGATPVVPQAPARGDDRDVTPFVTGTLDVMTPELPLPGSPRLFVGGEFGGSFGTDRKVARQGDPSVAGSPIEGGPTPFLADEATGQGTEVVAEYGDFVYAAQVGIAVPFELLGRQLRVRPSFGWTRFEIDIEGIVVDAECQVGGGVCNPNHAFGGFLRGARITGSESETFDGIGPGLELEMDTGRLGPFGTSIFVGGRAYRVLGDTEVDFAANVDFPPDPAGDDEYDARFHFEMDRWLYRAGVGFRMQWLGSLLD